MTACDPLTREECCDGTPCGDCPSEARTELRYDGTFDLTFLREGETVAAFPSIPGSCWVERPWGFGVNGTRIDVGDTLARNAGGMLYAYPTPPAPPLSPIEQATVDRFEAAPDPWEEG